MRLGIVWLCFVLAVIAAPAPAQGGGFAEIVGGMATPIGDDDYDDFVETSFKVGVRAGGYTGKPIAGNARLGIELGFDWTPAANELDDAANVDASFHRLRFLGGARANINLAKNAALFFRVGAGVDYVIGEMATTILGIDVEVDENDIGLALECGVGFAIEAGGVLVGGQLAFPMAFHDNDDDADIKYEYTGYDLDLLFSVGKRF
jgi:hypothetical protein